MPFPSLEWMSVWIRLSDQSEVPAEFPPLPYRNGGESNADLLPNGFAGKSASKVRWRRNGDGVQVGCIIGRVAEFDLVGRCVQQHLNQSAGWRAEAVAVQDKFLRGVSIDRDQERSLTLRHVIDLHLVSARDWHIHIVEGDGTLRVAAQVAHRSQAGAVSAKARRRCRRATQSRILRLIDGKGRIRFVAVSADNDAVHVRRIARRVS